jgi:hypothetical protein
VEQQEQEIQEAELLDKQDQVQLHQELLIPEVEVEVVDQVAQEEPAVQESLS